MFLNTGGICFTDIKFSIRSFLSFLMIWHSITVSLEFLTGSFAIKYNFKCFAVNIFEFLYYMSSCKVSKFTIHKYIIRFFYLQLIKLPGCGLAQVISTVFKRQTCIESPKKITQIHVLVQVKIFSV